MIRNFLYSLIESKVEAEVRYQVTKAYELLNKDLSELRFWVGSIDAKDSGLIRTPEEVAKLRKDKEKKMPSKSPEQHRLMEAVAHNPKFAKKVGIPQSVGKDFVEADKKQKKEPSQKESMSKMYKK